MFDIGFSYKPEAQAKVLLCPSLALQAYRKPILCLRFRLVSKISKDKNCLTWERNPRSDSEYSTVYDLR